MNMKVLFKGVILIGVTLGCIWGISLIWEIDRKTLCFIIGAIYMLIGSTCMIINMERRLDMTGVDPVSLEQERVKRRSSVVRLLMSAAVVVIIMGVFWR